MICKCENCKHRVPHEEGLLCGNKLCFVEPTDNCTEWDNEELFDPTKLVALAIIVVGVVIVLAKFL